MEPDANVIGSCDGYSTGPGFSQYPNVNGKPCAIESTIETFGNQISFILARGVIDVLIAYF